MIRLTTDVTRTFFYKNGVNKRTTDKGQENYSSQPEQLGFSKFNFRKI